MPVLANDLFENRKWTSLKSAVYEAKLLPIPEGIGGANSRFGYAVAIDADRAIVSGSNTADTGVVYFMDFDGNNWNGCCWTRIL